jgi:hypothetical protein
LILPTSVGAVVVDRTDAEERNGFNLANSPPLIYSFGYHTPSSNTQAYNKIISRISQNVKAKFEADPKRMYNSALPESVTTRSFK